MARRRTRSDIPTVPKLSEEILKDPENLGNYITTCIEATEWFGMPPKTGDSQGSPHCIDAIISAAERGTDSPVIITSYSGKEKAVLSAIAQRDEFVTSLSRALYHLYARNPKIDHEKITCAGTGRAKNISCMSKVIDVWGRLQPARVVKDQITQSMNAILASTRCLHSTTAMTCMSKVAREIDDPEFIARLLIVSDVDLTKDCGLSETEGTPCIQQVYESKSKSIQQAFDYIIEAPEVRELLKYPIFMSPLHAVPIVGYQYLIEGLQMGDTPQRVANYFKPRTGLMRLRFIDEDPYRTGEVFTNPLDYIMRVYATEDPEYEKLLGISKSDRSKVLDVAFTSPEISESVAKPVCRAAGDMVPCIDAIISSEVAPGTIGYETMKHAAFSSIDLAAARCFSPAGLISCFEKALTHKGNFKYVKDAISSGSTNLRDTQCGDTTCLDMVISGISRANLAAQLGKSLHEVSTKTPKEKKREDELAGRWFWEGKQYMDRAEAYERASQYAYSNAGPMSGMDEKERTELMNVAIRANAPELSQSSCRTLGMDGSIGGKAAAEFAAEWASKTVTEATFAQRMEIIERSLAQSGNVSCMQRVFQIIDIDPDSISNSTFEGVLFNPSVNLYTGGCYDYIADRPSTCMQAAISAAKKYGLNQWRMSKMASARASGESKQIRMFFETIPSTDTDKKTADVYLDKIISSIELSELVKPRCVGAEGSTTTCLSSVLEAKYEPDLPDDVRFKIISSTKAFRELKDQVVRIGGIDHLFKNLVCKDTREGVRGLNNILYRMKQQGRTLGPGDEGPGQEGYAVKYYGECHGCADTGTFESRRCFDDICFNGLVADDFRETMAEYYRDGTLYSNGGRDSLGISGVYKVKDPGQDKELAAAYIKTVRAIERKVSAFLSDPGKIPALRTKYKGGKNVVIRFMGFEYPNNPKELFEKPIAAKFAYVSEDADTNGAILGDTKLAMSEITKRPKEVGKLISTNADLAGEIHKVVTAKPSKGTVLTMVVSQRAADAMRASSCNNWTSCVSISASPSGGMVPNSLSTTFVHGIGGYTAYIASSEFDPMWFGRATIAAIDADGDGEPHCAMVTPLYGLPGQTALLRDALTELFHSKGINKTCPSTVEGSQIVGFIEAEKRMKRAYTETKANCISYNYNILLEKRMQEYEDTFGTPAGQSMREQIEAGEGKALRDLASKSCQISVRGRTGVPSDVTSYGSGSRQPISSNLIQFVPRGGLAALSYYPYFSYDVIGRDSTVSIKQTANGRSYLDFPITDSLHRSIVSKYGEDFVVKLREVAYA